MEIRIRLGMMKDYPSPYEDLSYDLVECKEHVDLSVEAARRSMVLLKNENNMLPLDVKKIRSIAAGWKLSGNIVQIHHTAGRNSAVCR